MLMSSGPSPRSRDSRLDQASDSMAYIEPPPWCNSTFRAGELHGRSVTFKLLTGKGIHEGNGRLIAEANKDGSVRAAVAFVRPPVNCSEMSSHSVPSGLWEFIPLDQTKLNKIER